MNQAAVERLPLVLVVHDWGGPIGLAALADRPGRLAGLVVTNTGVSPPRPGSRPISTAIGYNQLLTTNTLVLLAEQGNQIIKSLSEKAATLSGPRRQALDRKIAVVKRMVSSLSATMVSSPIALL